MIAAGESVFVDTNVLLSATAPARVLHRQALAVLDEWPRTGVELCLSGQVVREYLVVATRPLSVNGLGLSVSDAVGNIEAVLARARLLDEHGRVTTRLLELVGQARTNGKRIHDANVVATAMEHGVGKLVTDDVAHLRGLGNLRILDLSKVAVG